MRLERSLVNKNKVETKYKLSSTLKSWLPVLQANITELEEVIDGFKEENPILDIKSGHESEYAMDNFYKNRRKKSTPTSSTDKIEKLNFVKESIYDKLHKQIKEPYFPTKKSQNIAYKIIEDLDSDGFFDGDMSEIAEEFGIFEDEVERIRQRFSYIEPAGTASLDLCECFMFQLQNIENIDETTYQTTVKLIENFKDIHKFKNLKNFSEALDTLKKFRTIPFLDYKDDDRIIVPDIFINIQEDIETKQREISAIVNNNYYPTIGIDIEGHDDENEYIKQKIKEAKDVAESLNMRKSTITRIAEMIMDYQYDFFFGGEIKPMKLKDLAEDLEHNQSTISRAISNKYLECNRGIFPIKQFFTTALTSSTEEQQSDTSNSTIKSFIQEVIANENRKKPLSDDKILEQVKNKFSSIEIVRRTISKYRQQLNIGSSSERKKMYLVV
jgi:RNA polymerase sigma-54 factor